MILPLRNSKHRPPYFRGEGACCCAPVACPLLVWFPAKYFLPCRPFSVVFSVVFSTEKRRGRIFLLSASRHAPPAPGSLARCPAGEVPRGLTGYSLRTSWSTQYSSPPVCSDQAVGIFEGTRLKWLNTKDSSIGIPFPISQSRRAQISKGDRIPWYEPTMGNTSTMTKLGKS